MSRINSATCLMFAVIFAAATGLSIDGGLAATAICCAICAFVLLVFAIAGYVERFDR